MGFKGSGWVLALVSFVDYRVESSIAFGLLGTAGKRWGVSLCTYSWDPGLVANPRNRKPCADSPKAGLNTRP